MENRTAAPTRSTPAGKQVRRKPASKRFWRRIRQPLVESHAFKNGLASLLTAGLRFVRRTNALAPGSQDFGSVVAEHTPFIMALWHGQHLLAPAFNVKGHRITALFSRSADAELNALVAERFGFDVVRGSGGRQTRKGQASKGGASALIALKNDLENGHNVAMIADIPHGTPRQAGMGIVTLARLTGRPVIPSAIATSRRRILERTWDKTTLNLPFGKVGMVFGEPIHVPSAADDATMEAKRLEITEGLNEVTDEAYRLVDAPR